MPSDSRSEDPPAETPATTPPTASDSVPEPAPGRASEEEPVIEREGWRRVPPEWDQRKPSWWSSADTEQLLRSGVEERLRHPPPIRRPLPLGRIVGGLVLVAAGVLWLLAALDVLDVSGQLVGSVALIGLGVGLVVAARTGSHWGLIWLGILLTILLVMGAAFDVRLQGGVGERQERPTAVAELSRDFDLAVGQVTIDLTRVELPPGTTSMTASVGIGRLLIRVPAGTAVRVHGTAGVGQVVLFDDEHSGFGVDRAVERNGFGRASERVEIEATVGMGQVTVQEAGGQQAAEPVEEEGG